MIKKVSIFFLFIFSNFFAYGISTIDVSLTNITYMQDFDEGVNVEYFSNNKIGLSYDYSDDLALSGIGTTIVDLGPYPQGNVYSSDDYKVERLIDGIIASSSYDKAGYVVSYKDVEFDPADTSDNELLDGVGYYNNTGYDLKSPQSFIVNLPERKKIKVIRIICDDTGQDRKEIQTRMKIYGRIDDSSPWDEVFYQPMESSFNAFDSSSNFIYTAGFHNGSTATKNHVYYSITFNQPVNYKSFKFDLLAMNQTYWGFRYRELQMYEPTDKYFSYGKFFVSGITKQSNETWIGISVPNNITVDNTLSDGKSIVYSVSFDNGITYIETPQPVNNFIYLDSIKKYFASDDLKIMVSLRTGDPLKTPLAGDFVMVKDVDTTPPDKITDLKITSDEENINKIIFSWHGVLDDSGVKIYKIYMSPNVYDVPDAENYVTNYIGYVASVRKNERILYGASVELPVSGSYAYYKVRAYDGAGNYSESEPVINDYVIGLNGGTLGSESNVFVKIPPGALSSKQAVIIKRILLNNSQLASPVNNKYIKNGTSYVVAYELTVKDYKNFIFRKPIEVQLAYPDLGSYSAESDLALFYWDGMAWVKIPSITDTKNNLIRATVNHFSTYAVFHSNEAENSVAIKWKYNPFSPNNDGFFDKNSINITVFPADNISFKIYDLNGRIVRTLIDNEYVSSINVEWDGTNDIGEKLKTGTYIYQIESKAKTYNGVVVITR